MNSQQKILVQLNSLVIFRGILKNNVMKKMVSLLKVDLADTPKAINAYSEFVAALFKHTDNFSDYLLKAVLDDENIYIMACCEDLNKKGLLQSTLESELSILANISMFDAEHLKSMIKYYDWLASFNVTKHDFLNIYKKRIDDLHLIGFGIFAKYNVFTVKKSKLVPVKHPDTQSISTLSGYEQERNKVMQNTKALLNDEPAANVLLYGDAGTGKSSTVKAVANELFNKGLRLIEVKKNQLYQIPEIIDKLSINPLKFILFIDDLSFSSNDNDFAALKAILEGSVTGKGKNLAVYATSNRRHFVKENFADREGDEIHLGDTLQEVMSLSDRFGVKITFSRPNRDEYISIVYHLATIYEIDMPKDKLREQAEIFALHSNGRSPRAAKQFIEKLKAGG